jgi:hypothetical protein
MDDPNDQSVLVSFTAKQIMYYMYNYQHPGSESHLESDSRSADEGIYRTLRKPKVDCHRQWTLSSASPVQSTPSHYIS